MNKLNKILKKNLYLIIIKKFIRLKQLIHETIKGNKTVIELSNIIVKNKKLKEY